MLERLITPENSAEVVQLLTQKRGWSIRRVARTIDAPEEFIHRVKSGRQSLEYKDLESLAKACRQTPHLLIFDAIPYEKLSPDLKGLYASTRKVIKAGE